MLSVLVFQIFEVFPKDIRILKEYDEFVLTTNKEKISKDILFKYYTMITPEIVFCIRILTNIDLRKSLIITVNSFKDENENVLVQLSEMIKEKKDDGEGIK